MENRFYNAFDLEPLDPAPRGREGEYRTVFEINRDRIIHTSAFRRLQNKTQVFLSGEYDFYRTRLTHSIEVSQIGRGICAWLKRSGRFLDDGCFIDPDLVEAACLAHDLGHPPFGHAGERTLHRLMGPWGGFEGNAQTLRLLTETIFSESYTGMNPCRAFLDAVLKYKTLHAELENPVNHFLYDFQQRYLDFVLADQEFPLELTPGPVRDGFRSIECQIMDWADDTAYSLNDIADGIHAGFITLEALEKWAALENLEDAEAGLVTRLLQGIRDGKVENRLRRRVADFITATRLEPDANFMSGWSQRYCYRLAIDAEARQEAKLYKRIALHLVFRSRPLRQLEYKSDHMLTRLFEALAGRYLAGDTGAGSGLLSEREEALLAGEQGERGRARLLCDALSRMTDGGATRLYRRLFDAGFHSIGDIG